MKITTKRLILRPFEDDDFNDIHQLLSDPEVMRFSLNGPYSKEKTASFMAYCIQRSQNSQPSLLAIIDKKTNKFMGSCGFFAQKILAKQEIELGYRLSKQYWGKGFATEATIAVKQYAFNEMGLTRLISLIEKDNIASIAVAEKNGFKLEKELLYDGRINVCIYALSVENKKGD
ncbi:GNAT family N-acetyltransferase [Psychromonas sp. KJ10-10]|uniref:GNAT family N-acetyltransferase n=1 Tax=Psychromonas sp. KJ10-10 TaxID=3391823 RepID=UPI0039B59C97